MRTCKSTTDLHSLMDLFLSRTILGVSILISAHGCMSDVLADDASITTANINSSDSRERNNALNQIESRKDRKYIRNVEKLAQEDPDPTVRHTAISVMSQLGDDNSKRELVRIASSATDENDRQVAISSLPLLLSKEEAIPVFRQALQDQNGIVRIRAAGNLGKYRDYSGEKLLLKSSESKDQQTWTETMSAIGYVDTPAIRKRMEFLAAGKYRGNYEAKEAYRRLQYANISAEQQFSMGKSDAYSRYRGIVYLGCEKLANLETQEAIRLLFSLANDPNHYDSFRAARDTLLAKHMIDLSHYWDQPLKPKT